MIDRNKIRTMAILAVYDKKFGSKDRKIENNYKGDYIYKNNCINRIGVTIGFFIIICFYVFHLLFFTEFDITTFDYRGFVEKCGIAWLLLLLIYTIIGHFVYGREYDLAEKRLKGYEILIRHLDKN
ncbi:MAG: hypothetical protein KHZ62_03775 [Clostridiales bacterium]|nr:hypothetical protein [Clostridiales bacterium]